MNLVAVWSKCFLDLGFPVFHKSLPHIDLNSGTAFQECMSWGEKSPSKQEQRDDVRVLEVCRLMFIRCSLLILQPSRLHFILMDGVLSCASGQDRSQLVLNGPAAGS